MKGLCCKSKIFISILNVRVRRVFSLTWELVYAKPFCGNRLPPDIKSPVTLDWIVKSGRMNFEINATKQGYVHASFSEEGDALFIAEGELSNDLADEVAEIVQECQEDDDSLEPMKVRKFGKDKFQIQMEEDHYAHVFIVCTQKIPGSDFFHRVCARRDDDPATEVYSKMLEKLLGADISHGSDDDDDDD